MTKKRSRTTSEATGDCFVMDTDQSDAALVEALQRIGVRRSPKWRRRPGGPSYHSGLLYVSADGELRRRKNRCIRHKYVSYGELLRRQDEDEDSHSKRIHGEDTTTPKSVEFAGEIRIGCSFQADIPIWRGASTQPRNPTYADAVWQPHRCPKTASQHERDTQPTMDAFLCGRLPHDQRVQWMTALHQADYDAAAAEQTFVPTADTVVREPSKAEKAQFDQIIKQLSRDKEFAAAARTMGCSKERVMIQYYRWKGRMRGTAEYQQRKTASYSNDTTRALLRRPRNERLSLSAARALQLKQLHKELHGRQRRKTGQPPVVLPLMDLAVDMLDDDLSAEKDNDDIWKSDDDSDTAVSSENDAGASLEDEAEEDKEYEKDEEFVMEDEEDASDEEGGSKQQPQIPIRGKPCAKLRTAQSQQTQPPVPASIPRPASAFRSEVAPVPRVSGAFSYMVHIPFSPDGLLINVSQCSSGRARFESYRRLNPHIMGAAERANVFVAKGDWVVLIDNIDCRFKPFEEVVRILKARNNGRGKWIRMLHLLQQPGHLPGQPQPAGNALPARPPGPIAVQPSPPHYRHPDNGVGGPPPMQCHPAYGQQQAHRRKEAPQHPSTLLAPGHPSAPAMNRPTYPNRNFPDDHRQPQQNHYAPALQPSPVTQRVPPRAPPMNNSTVANSSNNSTRKVDIRVTVEERPSSPKQPARHHVLSRSEPLNSNGMRLFWDDSFRELQSFFARRGLVTIDDVLQGNADFIAKELAKEKHLPFDHARDLVGIVRVKLASLVMTAADTTESS